MTWKRIRGLLMAFMAVSAFVLTTAASRARAVPERQSASSFDRVVSSNAAAMLEEGRRTFRYDTFGDEAFWGDTLRLHETIEGAALGGVGAGVSAHRTGVIGPRRSEGCGPTGRGASTTTGGSRPCSTSSTTTTRCSVWV